MAEPKPLEFDGRRLLPEGIHHATMVEIDKHFATFQRSDRRIRLFEHLKRYVREIQTAQWNVSIIIDGSFIMPPVDEPGDIDVILVLPQDWDNDADLRPFEYNLLSKRVVKREYKFDLVAVRKGSSEEEHWVRFFSQVKVDWCRMFGWPEDSKKGIVRIVP